MWGIITQKKVSRLLLLTATKKNIFSHTVSKRQTGGPKEGYSES